MQGCNWGLHVTHIMHDMQSPFSYISNDVQQLYHEQRLTCSRTDQSPPGPLLLEKRFTCESHKQHEDSIVCTAHMCCNTRPPAIHLHCQPQLECCNPESLWKTLSPHGHNVPSVHGHNCGMLTMMHRPCCDHNPRQFANACGHLP